MTTMTLTSGFHYGSRPPISTTGVSKSATLLANLVRRNVVDRWRSASGQGAFFAAISALGDSYEEAKIDAHSGEQLFPSPGAWREAQELLEALPHWCTPPSPVVEPSGAIGLEWDLGPHRWLILALKGTGTIEHSAVLGLGNELYGTTNFAGTLGKRERRLLLELMQLDE